MNEFNKLDEHLQGADPYLNTALAERDLEAPQAAFDAFASAEKQAELHFLPVDAAANAGSNAPGAANNSPTGKEGNVLNFRGRDGRS